MMRIYYFFETLFKTDWTDICVDCPIENHAINVSRADHVIEFSTLGLILDLSDTTLLLGFLFMFLVRPAYNFWLGYKGK